MSRLRGALGRAGPYGHGSVNCRTLICDRCAPIFGLADVCLWFISAANSAAISGTISTVTKRGGRNDAPSLRPLGSHSSLPPSNPPQINRTYPPTAYWDFGHAGQRETWGKGCTGSVRDTARIAQSAPGVAVICPSIFLIEHYRTYYQKYTAGLQQARSCTGTISPRLPQVVAAGFVLLLTAAALGIVLKAAQDCSRGRGTLRGRRRKTCTGCLLRSNSFFFTE